MPFSKELPEWFKAATTPTNTKKTEGWGAGEHPPAALFNWFFNTSYEAIKELRENAVHNDQKGVANGVASLDGTGDIPIGQADNILNWVKGFGLGGAAKDIGASDLNSLDATGFYFGDNLVSSPDPGLGWYVIHVKQSTVYKVQFAIRRTANAILYTRINNNGTWGAWQQLASYDTNGKLPQANLPAATTTVQGAVQLNDNINSTSTSQAATANAVKKVMDFIAGAGLGDVSKDISSTDLNNLDVTGFYKGGTLTNAPENGPYYFIINQKNDALYKSQLALQFNGTKAGTIYHRVKNNNSWTPWTQLATYDSNGKISATNLPDATTSAKGATQLNDATNSNSVTQAATANAVKQAMDYIKGAGLGKDAGNSLPQAADLNKVIDSGIYRMNTGHLNAPNAIGYSQLLVMRGANNSDTIAQIVVQYTNGAVWVRSGTPTEVGGAGTWTTWTQLAAYDGNGKVAATNLPDATTSAKGVAQLNDTTNSGSTTQAATANAVKKVMDIVAGAGVGGTAKIQTNIDVNTYDGTGFYYVDGASTTNTPTPGVSGYYIINIKNTATFKSQLAINVSNNIVYSRVSNNGTWSAWKKIAFEDFVTDTVNNAMTAHESKTNNPHNVTTAQVNVYTPAVNAADSGDNIPEGATVGTLPANPVGYPKTWGLITNHKVSNFRCTQHWYDTGSDASNRGKPQYRTWYNGVGWTGWVEIETAAGAQAKADATQVFKLTANDGRAKSLALNADLNTITDAGFYYANSTTLINAPIATGGTLEVIFGDSNTTTQRYTIIGNPTREFYRMRSGGTWNPWKESASVDQVQMSKITGDTGADKYTIIGTEDLLAKAASWGVGFHTFYAPPTAVNLPIATAGRGFMSRSGTLGYLCFVNQSNVMYTNHFNNGGWSGWAKVMTEYGATFLGTLYATSPNGDKQAVITTKNDGDAGNNGIGIGIGAGGYTVIGSGESAQTILNDANYLAHGGVETMEVASDNDVLITPGLDSVSPSSAKRSVFRGNGTLNLPYQSFVNVSNTGIGTQDLAPTVDTKITILGNKHLDIQNEFANNTYTTKETGNYIIRTAIDWGQFGTPAGISYLTLRKNGVLAANLSVTSNIHWYDSFLPIRLFAGDTLEFYITQNDQGTKKITSVNVTIAKFA